MTKQTGTIYCRVSSKGQALEGRDGFRRQIAACEAYAKKEKIEIAETYRDEISGTTSIAERPAMTRMLELLAEIDVDCVLLEKQDRLSRDLVAGELILGEFKKRGIKVIEVESGSDLTDCDTPTSKLIRQIIGSISEFDKSSIVAKLAEARRNKKRENNGQKLEGRKHYGEVDQREKDVVAEIRRLCRKPRKSPARSFALIAGELNNQGHKTRMGKTWTAVQVRRIVVRNKWRKVKN